MADRPKQRPNSDRASRHLEESVSSGLITEAEADVIKLFFASPTEATWPANELQRRMQSSGR